MPKRYYNIPSNNRELQLLQVKLKEVLDYNIPSNNRELQQKQRSLEREIHYNIPSNNRELQQYQDTTVNVHIITYQVITGNYSIH